MTNDERIYPILQRLIKDEWVTLAHLSVLLGYTEPTTLYQRQARYAGTDRAIPTIRVGTQHRVNEDTVVRLLEASSQGASRFTYHTQVVLKLYRSMKNAKLASVPE